MLAIDQYGNRISIPGKHPRKELLAAWGRKSARKMYIDDAEGNAKHIGYVIGSHWFTLYDVAAL